MHHFEEKEMTDKEEVALRELAAGRCCTQSVIDALGPMSLWSKQGLESEIKKAIEAEREACAEVCATDKKQARYWVDTAMPGGYYAAAIRARGETK